MATVEDHLRGVEWRRKSVGSVEEMGVHGSGCWALSAGCCSSTSSACTACLSACFAAACRTAQPLARQRVHGLAVLHELLETELERRMLPVDPTADMHKLHMKHSEDDKLPMMGMASATRL